MSLGLELVKIHRVLSFKQSKYLAEYIDFNTKKRAMTKLDYEKNLFKLLNNAIFGKTCENVEKRIDVKLFTDPHKFTKTTSKPNFKDFRIFSEGLTACQMGKTQVKYDRPMIVGMCILDLSKVLMYDFHYNTMVKKYGDNLTLMFTDTDSLCYHIKTKDIFEDMNTMITQFDTSDYPKENQCYSESNKKLSVNSRTKPTHYKLPNFVH
jgi:hypothetical protein